MGIYIEPAYMSKKEANEKTTMLNRPDLAQRREYLKNHTIAETVILPKKK